MFLIAFHLSTALACLFPNPGSRFLVPSSQGGDTHILFEQSGGFSFNPPPNWQAVEFPGLKYRIAQGPPESGFTPNIVVVDEKYSGTLPHYVEANLVNMELLLQNLKVLQRQNLRTDDGEPVVRVLTENFQQGRLLRQTFYFLGSGDRKFVLTCTALADGGEKYDQVFLTSAESFQIH